MEWVSVRLKADARLTQSATTRFSLLCFLWVTVSLGYAKEMVTDPRAIGAVKNAPLQGHKKELRFRATKGDRLSAIKDRRYLKF